MLDKLADILKNMAWSIADVLKSMAWSILNLLVKILSWIIKLALIVLASVAGFAFIIGLIQHMIDFFSHAPADPKITFDSWFFMVGEAVLVIGITIFINYDGDYLADRKQALAEQRRLEQEKADRIKRAAEREAEVARQARERQRELDIKANALWLKTRETVKPPQPAAAPPAEPTPIIKPATAATANNAPDSSHLDQLLEKARQNPPKRNLSKREQRDRINDARHRASHPPIPEAQAVKLDNEL